MARRGPPPPLQCYGSAPETHGHILVISPALGHKLTKTDRKYMDALASNDPVLFSQAELYFRSSASKQIFDASIEPNDALRGFMRLKQFVKTRRLKRAVKLRFSTILEKPDAKLKDQTEKAIASLEKLDLASVKSKIVSKWASRSLGDDEAIYFQVELPRKTLILGLQLHDGTQDCLTLTSKVHRRLLPDGADRSMIPENYPFRSPVSAPYTVTYFYGPRIFNSMNLSLALEKNPHHKPVGLPQGHKQPMKYLNEFWQFHTGVDYSVRSGTPVYAPYDGAVFAFGRMGCAGNTLILAHSLPGSGGKVVFSVYEHLKDFSKTIVARDGTVRVHKGADRPRKGERFRRMQIGDPVEGGQIVARSGESGTKIGFSRGFKQGCVDGAHLHFEVRMPRSLTIGLSRQIASVEGGVRLGEIYKRFRYIESETVALNPADFVPGLDEACQIRKKAEIKNAIALHHLDYRKVPPITAGLCSLRFEASLAEVPSLYRLTRTMNLMQDDDGLPGKFASSEATGRR